MYLRAQSEPHNTGTSAAELSFVSEYNVVKKHTYLRPRLQMEPDMAHVMSRHLMIDKPPTPTTPHP